MNHLAYLLQEFNRILCVGISNVYLLKLESSMRLSSNTHFKKFKNLKSSNSAALLMKKSKKQKDAEKYLWNQPDSIPMISNNNHHVNTITSSAMPYSQVIPNSRSSARMPSPNKMKSLRQMAVRNV